MTLPTIAPGGGRYSGTRTDPLRCKADKGGDVRNEALVTAVPSGTVVTTIVGLSPFRIGCRLGLSSHVIFDALGASVTASIGYIYLDNVGNTNNPTAFANASTTAAAGGVVALNNAAASTFISTGDGWFCVTLGGATTASTGNITSNLNLVYDLA